MLDLVKRRAFMLVGGVFLVYGVSAMGGESKAGAKAEAKVLPSIRADFLRVRGPEEVLERVSNPFVLDSEEEIVIPPEDLTKPPDALRYGAPLPGVLEPESVLPQPTPVSQPLEVYEPERLFEWPEGFLLTLDATMSAAGTQSARINGRLLLVGDSLMVSGQEMRLEAVEGTSAILSWRSHPIRLDLLERASVEAAGMPIDR